MVQRHPRFQPGPSSGRLDGFSERGAHELARRIRAAWAKVGWDVEVRVERIASEELDDGRSIAHYTVRSDLMNGLAQRRRDESAQPDRRAA
ncbi:hypothetical protein [Azospirillum picis]|uniref:Dodecin domain-containing protein n=1 Tax=Azospirillum picis TaxID=488438 RepID=A0ABU0MIG1_9PROT|nr:hypothetical protein [Azospirillum picis]MBP2299631.1 hypothetical protein [Azospirillum picis]MDQ0533242.1 hypothetical protein [Azospirillum picis]